MTALNQDLHKKRNGSKEERRGKKSTKKSETAREGNGQ